MTTEQIHQLVDCLLMDPKSLRQHISRRDAQRLVYVLQNVAMLGSRDAPEPLAALEDRDGRWLRPHPCRKCGGIPAINGEALFCKVECLTPGCGNEVHRVLDCSEDANALVTEWNTANATP